jgi:hypothetical protein
MNSMGKYVFLAAALTMATQAVAQHITFFGREAYQGNSITADRGIGNLQRSGFNERASSAVVSGNWEVCDGRTSKAIASSWLPGISVVTRCRIDRGCFVGARGG